MYLFDTDTITNIYKKRPSPNLVRRLSQTAPEHQHITVITVAEIVYGAKKSQRPDHHLGHLTALLSQVAVLDFDLNAAVIAGGIRAGLEIAGTRLPWADIQIAAIAQFHELTLITGNVTHFSRIPGLRVANWLEDGDRGLQ